MKKNALFWELEQDYIRCKLCPHNCFIKPNHSGICKVRYNEDFVLYTSAYQNICALAIDPIEKKPLYHFLPGTKTLSFAIAGCNLKCKNCQNSHISQQIDCVDTENLTPQEIITICLARNCPSISFTYSEPTIFYEFMLETAELAKIHHIKTVMVSNGYICKEPLLKLIPFLDAANIDVKAFSEHTYYELTGGKLKPVLETIKTLIQQNVHVELTYLMVPNYSDDIIQIEQFIDWLISEKLSFVPLHFTRFFPRHQLTNLYPTPIDHIRKALEIAQTKGIAYVYAGNVSL
ncbi:MAG: AmmeMemoRadiSam system radical SAM enzyme [Bacteroidales bacterium]|nr:AmmeMemoRadiSam system radical SAM enzyme [Bacteroidales bacterium]